MTLEERVLAYNMEIHDALQTIYDELNKGQKKKIAKADAVKALFERYHINTEDIDNE